MKFSLEKVLFGLFVILVFSLAFMQPNYSFGKFKLPFTDLIFLLTFALWTILIIFKKKSFRWHNLYWCLIFYFCAMLISAIFSNNPRDSFVKLSGEIYLLGLSVLTFNVVRNFSEIKFFIYAWLTGTFFAVFFGFLALFLFYFAAENEFLNNLLFYQGSLPSGNYPRIKSTFLNSNLFCNYLTAGLMLAFVAHKLNFLRNAAFYPLVFGILLIALFTISPGLGGIAFCIGIWFWNEFREKNDRSLAYLSLLGGIFISIAFLFVTSIAFQSHPTAPFIIKIPFFDLTLFPSVRLMIWIESFNTFIANLLVGAGLGEDVCRVSFVDPNGNHQILTDAHNLFLNVAGQMGIFGLSAIILIIFFLLKSIFMLPNSENLKILKLGFGLIFVSCFIYQGLSGSFENARHIWVIIGIILSLDRLDLSHSPQKSFAHFSC